MYWGACKIGSLSTFFCFDYTRVHSWGKEYEFPFFILSTNVCVSQNLLGSETLVSMCVLFVLPVICLQLDGIKARKNNFFEKLELDLLGDLCSMKHYACACPSLMEATLLKGWRWQEIFLGKTLKEQKYKCLLLESWCMHDYLALTGCCLNSLHSLFWIVKISSVSWGFPLSCCCILMCQGAQGGPLCPCNVPMQGRAL